MKADLNSIGSPFERKLEQYKLMESASKDKSKSVKDRAKAVVGMVKTANDLSKIGPKKS